MKSVSQIESDRRSNHEIQIELQKRIYHDYGYFYERKAGEFHDGIKENIIDKAFVINRLTFIKAYKAYLGEPAAARRTSETFLFKEDAFYKVLGDIDKYQEMFFSYLLFDRMEKIENSFDKKFDSTDKYGYSLLYGKWAVISSIGITKPVIIAENINIFEKAQKLIEERLSIWPQFDEFIKEKRKDTKYFREEKYNYELYYKVNLLDEDVKEYFLR